MNLELDSAIRTKRLLLRRAAWDDLKDIHAVMSAPTAMRYWSRLPHETLEVTERGSPAHLWICRTRKWMSGSLRSMVG